MLKKRHEKKRIKARNTIPVKRNDLLNERISLCSYKDYNQDVRSTCRDTRQLDLIISLMSFRQ